MKVTKNKTGGGLNIKVSKAEALILKYICSLIGGPADTSPRGMFDELLNKIDKYYPDPTWGEVQNKFVLTYSSTYFKDNINWREQLEGRKRVVRKNRAKTAAKR